MRVLSSLLNSMSHRYSMGSMLILLTALTSCSVGPNFKAPDLVMPGKWKNRSNVSDLPVPDQWWTLFRNPTLNRLVDQALSGNQDLRAALARVETARAITGINRADWFPSLSSATSGTLIRASGNNINAGGFGGVSSADLERESYVTSLNLNYEIDIWGRVRRSVEGAKARQFSTEETLATLRLTVASEVARNYFLLTSLEAQTQVLRDTIGLRDDALDLQQSRFKGGLANEMDVARSRTELELARNDLAAIERQRGAAENALAVLCGEMPSTFKIATGRSLPVPPTVPSGMPSQLLQRRPDIRAAEQSLRAANADIGVAKASFFPVFRLTGSGGLESLQAKDFIDWRSRAYSIGPSVELPIFQGGRILSNYKASKSRYDESRASYQQTLLTALREVEDSMLDLRAYGRQRNAVAAALAAAQDTSRLARLRYDKGLASYFEVVDADRTVLTTRLALAQIDGQRLISSVSLLKALGGGWVGSSGK